MTEPGPGRPLRMGMVGGGRGAFIGAVHRAAATMDGEAVFTAGALSSTPDKALASGRELHLPDDRNHPTWREMVDRESARDPGDRIDLVSIVTPNATHFEIAKAFVEAGIHVVIDKPMACTSAEAEQLAAAVEKAGVVCCVTYTYCGYPMVAQARELVRSGELGEIRKVIVEYNQGWLASALERTGHKQAAWRTDPSLAGPGGAIGDIGSHAEHLVRHAAGLEVESICADLTTFIPGRALDDDANLLLRFKGGARGVLVASQICAGEENNLVLRIWGTKGGLEWRQHEPNSLIFRPADGPERVYRHGHAYNAPSAAAGTRLPPGHPEGLIESLANIYRNAYAAARAPAGDRSGARFGYPDARDGAAGVRFIEKTVESARSERKWTPL